MTTITEVSAQPSSGITHVDALLARGPGWNWLAPERTELRYTFALTPGDPRLTLEKLTGALTAFNADQQAAVVTALALIAGITGITFVATADGTQADLHFAAGNLTPTENSGVTSWNASYGISGTEAVNYTLDAWVYLDNVEFAGSNANPAPGGVGYEVLLHELGHAMGLKHPFGDGVTLPDEQNSTEYTLMSYEHVGGPYSDFRAFDIAALMFLYGGDGLGGALGHSTSGRYLVGTDDEDQIAGGDGDDVLDGSADDDSLDGGPGRDTAVFAGLRAAYTVSTISGGFRVVGPDGTDTLESIERARFDDQTLDLSTGGVYPPTGTLTVAGTPRQGTMLSVSSTVADLDGLGTLRFRWQAEGSSGWADIGGASGNSFTPLEAQVGQRLRVVGSYTDGAGSAEVVLGTPSAAVANVNETPSGGVAIDGVLRQGELLSALSTLADPDGLGTFAYRWQSSLGGGAWQDLADASTASFVPAEAQVGQRLRVRVEYTDSHGTLETSTSAASAAVANRNDAPSGSVSASGTAAEDSRLTAAVAIADADGLGSIGYRWQVSSGGLTWDDVNGATGDTFTPGDAQVGSQLRVVASYTDARGTPEQVTSAATPAVVNVNDAPVGAVAVQGVAEQGHMLRAAASLSDADGLGVITLEWQSSRDGLSWAAVPGLPGSQVTLGAAQIGELVRAVARYVDGRGMAESVASSPSAAVLGVVPGGAADDDLRGSAFADRINGAAGDDTLTGAGGNDLLFGDAGLDTARYTGPRSQYVVQPQAGGGRSVSGSEGNDQLSSIERIAFADAGLALDLDGAAGTVARFLGAVFGRDVVGNQRYAGIGLAQLDGGASASALMSLALETRLGAGYSAEAEVMLLYRNLTAVDPSPAELAFWVGTLSAGQYTPVTLALMAADHPLNAQNIDLVGLAQTGLAYAPEG